jgi:hypothetical protein
LDVTGKPAERLNTIDGYERHLAATLDGWTPLQRSALSAAMADRWLPVYAAFSEREGWGNPETWRR